ncbi:hypothetical protein [Geobacter sp.]|uniref:hypothetical protein n=1 Tax=Geobacter sp. TaxID=46610 RepID=UPI00262B433A|nr:hypothetical protein [Geobacter sp.]
MLTTQPHRRATRLAALSLAGFMTLAVATPVRASSAGPDKGYLPVEATVPSPVDAHLTELFTPPFGYREIKVTPGGSARKLVTITSDRILNGRTVRKFNENLLSKGISVFGAAYYGDFSWGRTVVDAAITATRKVAGEADTIEVSEGIARDPQSGEPLMPLTVSVDEISIPLREDFGTSWRKVRLIPDREPAVTDPKTGRYPGSRVRLVREDDPDRKDLFYAVKGNLVDVERYFEERLKDLHRTVIVTGSETDEPAPTEIFGIKTPAQVIVLSGYTFQAATRKLSSTEVTLKRASDANLAPYVEVEVTEN